MSLATRIALTTVFVTAFAAPSFAQDAKAIQAAIEARKAQMTLYTFNLGLLGGMAKGEIDYNADSAQAAASGILTLTKLDAARMWPAGSDEMSVDGTRAKAEMWDNMQDVFSKAMMMQSAAEAMDGAAGQGVDALRGAMGGLGGACGACHKAYRAPKN